MAGVPSQYQSVYDSSWQRFADLVPEFVEDGCTCKKGIDKINFHLSYSFLKSADIRLNQGDTTGFGNFINAANTLLNTIQK